MLAIGISATTADVPLIANASFNFGVQMVGEESRDDNGVLANFVETRFFDVLEIPLLAGREFSDTDGLNTATAIVNESFLRQFERGPPSDVIGRQIDFSLLANTSMSEPTFRWAQRRESSRTTLPRSIRRSRSPTCARWTSRFARTSTRIASSRC